MKTPRILVLLISLLLLGCAKEDGVGINSFSGKDIDSIVYYTITGSDTIPYYAKKISFSEDKNTITEQWYERVESQPNLIPTIKQTYSNINNRIVINSIFSNDTDIVTYLLNQNKCIIRRTIRNARNKLLDSAVYKYYNDNYLQKVEQYPYVNSGETPRLDTIISMYYWSNGNIIQVKHTRKSSNKEFDGESFTNYTSSDLLNPIAYNYLNNYYLPYLKYGRSSKNLVSKEMSFFEFETASATYNYKLHPSNNSYLTIISPPSNMIYRIFYK